MLEAVREEQPDAPLMRQRSFMATASSAAVPKPQMDPAKRRTTRRSRVGLAGCGCGIGDLAAGG